jgi:hypothetical protein
VIKEALQYIVGLGPANFHKVGDVEFADRDLKLVTPPAAKKIEVHSLTAFCDLVKEQFEGFDPAAVVVHVEDCETVTLVSKASDPYGRRREYIGASPLKCKQFPFEQFQTPEAFIIGLQSLFDDANGTDLDYVVRIASNISSRQVATSLDDGISQTVELKKGAVMVEGAVIKPRVKLAPYRTFRELEQPISEFVLRLRDQNGQPPAFALFEADGGAWRLAAMERAKHWLTLRVKPITVVA